VTVIRGLTLTLVLAMSPLPPAVCAVVCAEGAHTMPGMSAAGHHDHQMHMASHQGAHPATANPVTPTQGERLGAAPDGPCDHALGIGTFVRPDDSTRLGDLAVSVTTVAVLLDEPQGTTLRFTSRPSASPPLSRLTTAPLRI